MTCEEKAGNSVLVRCSIDQVTICLSLIGSGLSPSTNFDHSLGLMVSCGIAAIKHAIIFLRQDPSKVIVRFPRNPTLILRLSVTGLATYALNSNEAGEAGDSIFSSLISCLRDDFLLNANPPSVWICVRFIIV